MDSKDKLEMKGYPSLFILLYPSLSIYFIVFLQGTLVLTPGFGWETLQA